MRAGMALVVVILNIIAIVSVLGARTAAGRRLAWTAAIVALPLVGAIAWLAGGRRRAARSTGGTER